VLERVRELERRNAEAQGRKGAQSVGGAEGAEAPLSAKEKKIYEQGLVGILKQLHDELDAAVAEAYGWPATQTPDDILTRLVALNAERAAEEANGVVRWLRPEYQNKGAKAGAKGKQAALEMEEELPSIAALTLVPWPTELQHQAAALATVLGGLHALSTVEEIAAHFESSTKNKAGGKASNKRLEEITRLLETFAVVGRARKWNGKWSGL